MEYHRFSDYIRNQESVGQEYAHSVTVTTEQWRQVTGMVRMFALAGIIMYSGQRERIVAVPWLNQRRIHAGIPVMQMEAKDAGKP